MVWLGEEGRGKREEGGELGGIKARAKGKI
jgi:hypothetical protein